MALLDEKIAAALARPEARRFLEAAFAVEAGKEGLYRDGFGLNFHGGEPLNLKLIFAFFGKLARNEASALLPTLEHYDLWEPKWRASKVEGPNNQGLAMVIKLPFAGGAPTYQFYFRLPMSAGLAEPKRLKLGASDRAMYQGISYDYTGGVALEKHYFYLRATPEAHAQLARFGEVRHDGLIEVCEADKGDKLIHMLPRLSEGRAYWASLAAEAPAVKAAADWGRETLGCEAMFPGVYEDRRTRAMYFFKPASAADTFASGPENTRIETLARTLLAGVR